MADAAACYKKANAQASAPLGTSSSLSALEESIFFSSDGEGGETTSQSNIEESSSKGKSLQNTCSTRVSDPTHVSDPSQASNPTRQEEQTVVQMDTDDADKQQELGASSGQGEDSRCGENAHSENPDLQTQRESVEFRGEVRVGQSNNGGVHSVANETFLPSRAHTSTSSSVQASTHSDSTLDRLSRAEFHDSRSRGSSRASASATRDVDSLQSTRAAFLGESRDASLNVSRGAMYQDFGDPNMASFPRRPFEDFSKDPPSIGSRPATLYVDILWEVLRTVSMPDLLVRGLPPPSSPWALLPDEPQDNWSVALALDDHILQELLNAFKAPEPRTRLVEQNSSFRISQALYPKFFKAPPMDEQVLATSNARGSVPAATVIDHRKVVEALYEAFMATFRMNSHTSALVRFFFDTALDRTSRDVALYLYRSLVEQRSICFKGASSSLGLVCRQAVKTLTLGNWTPLRSCLAPIPFKGGLFFGGEILQQADCLDKEEEQLKKACSFGSRQGYLRNIFRGHSRGGSTSQSPAPAPALTSQQPQSSSRGGNRARLRSHS